MDLSSSLAVATGEIFYPSSIRHTFWCGEFHDRSKLEQALVRKERRGNGQIGVDERLLGSFLEIIVHHVHQLTRMNDDL